MNDFVFLYALSFWENLESSGYGNQRLGQDFGSGGNTPLQKAVKHPCKGGLVNLHSNGWGRRLNFANQTNNRNRILTSKTAIFITPKNSIPASSKNTQEIYWKSTFNQYFKFLIEFFYANTNFAKILNDKHLKMYFWKTFCCQSPKARKSLTFDVKHCILDLRKYWSSEKAIELMQNCFNILLSIKFPLLY